MMSDEELVEIGQHLEYQETKARKELKRVERKLADLLRLKGDDLVAEWLETASVSTPLVARDLRNGAAESLDTLVGLILRWQLLRTLANV